MGDILVVASLIVVSAVISVVSTRKWPRVVMASVLLLLQLLILVDFDIRSRQVLVEDRQSGSTAPAWEVVGKVRDAQLVDRACAGLTGLGLFLLVVVNRRSVAPAAESSERRQ
jgi:hypothetical protein